MFNNSWNLQDAKKHFSRLVDSAMTKGPQVVTKRGKHAVVVLSFELYQQLIKPEKDLVKFFQSSPLKGIELNLDRQSDIPMEIE